MKSDDMGRFFLEQLGFSVESIPTSDKKEADFLVKIENVNALIEVKLKVDNPKLLEKKEATLKNGEVFVVEEKLGRNETLSGIIKKASSQLKSSDKKHDFKILLFITSGITAKTKSEQFKDTIYGSTQIFEVEKKSKLLKTCYFFRNSDFYRRKSIDAAIIICVTQDKAAIELCLNTYSDRYELLKSSAFMKPFGEAVVDPIEREKNGNAYILNGDVERRKTDFEEHFSSYDPVLIYLAKKYNTGLLHKVDFDCPSFITQYESKP